MMTPTELAGIALNSDSTSEIVSSIRQCLETSDEVLFAECAHAIGHLAWRFHLIDPELLAQFWSHADNFSKSMHVQGAIQDMKADIQLAES